MKRPRPGVPKLLALALTVSLLAGAGAARAQDTGEPWHGEATFGLSLAKGNSNTLLLNASASVHREWEQNEFRVSADGQYGLNNVGRPDETLSANSVHGFAEYKRLFTERSYGDLRIDGSHDDVADIRYRVIAGPAVGYYFIKSVSSRLSGETGPAFVTEKLGDQTNNYATWRISERGEHSFANGSKVWEQIEYLPRVDDFNQYLLNAEVAMGYDDRSVKPTLTPRGPWPIIPTQV